MAYASKATTALVAAALGLATVTATFVTISSASSVADPAPAKIQDRLQSEVRLIAIDDPTDTVIETDATAGLTIASRIAQVPLVPQAADLTAELGDIAPGSVPLPRAKPVDLATLSSVPLPLSRPQAEMVIGSLDTRSSTEMR